MKDYSGEMRSMGIHRGNNYEMNIILEKPEFTREELLRTFNSAKLSWNTDNEKYLVKMGSFQYNMVLSKSIKRGYYRLKISQEKRDEINWKRENNLLTVTYLIWSELAGKIPYDTGLGYYIDEWDKVFILNEVEFDDFKNHQDYRIFTGTDLKNWSSNELIQNTQIAIILKGYAYVCIGDKNKFKDAFDFWILGTSELIKKESGNSDLWDGRFLPISRENLETELNSLCSNLDILLGKETLKSAMKMRYDKVFSGWYFVETENKYHIIDLTRTN